MGKTRREQLRERWLAAHAKLRERWLAVGGAAAAGAGLGVRTLPGVAGPLLIAYGLWLAWSPLGYMALGGFLLLADRRMP